MKNFWKVIATLLFVFTTISLIFPGTVSAANAPVYPTSIDGLPVVLVEDSTNTVSMPAGDVILCLYDKTSSTLEDSLSILNSSSDLVDNPLPKGWSIEVLGGPGASVQKFLADYNQFNEYERENGPVIWGQSASMNASEPATSNSITTNMPGVTLATILHPSYTLFEDDDTAYGTETYQSVYLNQPAIGSIFPPPLLYCAITNNFATNGSSSSNFLQAGQCYQSNGTIFNGWSNFAFQLNAQNFNIASNFGDQMKFELYYTSSPGLGGYWVESCRDITQGIWVYHPDFSITGNQAQTLPSSNTSVWFENEFTSAYSNWWNGYTNPIAVYGAQNGTLNNPTSWTHDQIIIEDNNGNYHLNNGQITGNITSGGWGWYWLNNLLLGR